MDSMLTVEGICEGQSSAGYVKLARGSDGLQHVISDGSYPDWPPVFPGMFQLLSVVFCVAHNGDRVETSEVRIGLSDVRVLGKGLSCTLI